jgi:DNA polymerase-3 subunit delta'
VQVDALVVQILSLARAGRVSHAAILSGLGDGALAAAATRVSAALLCPAQRPGADACGQCPDCLRLQSGNHERLDVIEPDGATLKIAQIRQARARDVHVRIGGPRIVVFTRAQALTAEAAAGLLTWLEEPRAQRMFFLLAPSADSLLATIRSRAMTIVLSGTARELDAASFGLADAPDRFAALVQAVLQWTERWARDDNSLWQYAGTTVAKTCAGAEDGIAVVDLLAACLRDLVALQNGGQPWMFAQHTQQLAACAVVTRERAAVLSERLLGCRRRLQSHVSVVSALEWLALA